MPEVLQDYGLPTRIPQTCNLPQAGGDNGLSARDVQRYPCTAKAGEYWLFHITDNLALKFGWGDESVSYSLIFDDAFNAARGHAIGENRCR